METLSAGVCHRPCIAQRTAIEKSAFESDSGDLGAATLVIERLLGNEILNL